jgi:hypothetical protein
VSDSNLPNWMKDQSNRKTSDKKVKKLAKKLKGKPTINSGATLQQNDLVTPEYDIEHKFTDCRQYTLKVDELEKMTRRSGGDKIPVFVIEMGGRNWAVLELDYLTNK